MLDSKHKKIYWIRKISKYIGKTNSKKGSEMVMEGKKWMEAGWYTDC